MADTAPDYWHEACAALAGDAVMAGLIARHPGSLVTRGDAFHTLARAIVGQQISVKAADSIWTRLSNAYPITAASLAEAEPAALQACGLSGRKAEYLRDLASHFAEGRLDPDQWPGMDDSALIAALVRVRGIGRWTAEMFLMFHLLRPDIWPVDDIGLQKAISCHYLQGDAIAPRPLRTFGERFAPWRSVATWYLWRSLDPVVVAY
jgi:DNA-3-methyladenine glycosylase II